MPIEQIVEGDRVWAYDHQRLVWAERRVVEVYQLLHQGGMATLVVGGETLRATGGHPFWVVSGEALAERPLPGRIEAHETGGRQAGRWVLARDLRLGDELLTRGGEILTLQTVQVDKVEEVVYNFHVAELQNYAVGVLGALVHNTNTPDLTPGEAANPAQNVPNTTYNSIRDALGDRIKSFTPRKGGLTKNKVDNTELLNKLRDIEPGRWQKVYRDGMIDGKRVSLHYFESPSGKVFDPAIKPGWSN